MDNNESNSTPGFDASPKKARKKRRTNYLAAASRACNAGDRVLGMHLYLAAYERASQQGLSAAPQAIEALHRAWDLAIELEERSIAEYAFEKLEPYLSEAETSEFSRTLQRLAIDRLARFGLSHENLEDMTDAVLSMADAPFSEILSFSVGEAQVDDEEHPTDEAIVEGMARATEWLQKRYAHAEGESGQMQVDSDESDDDRDVADEDESARSAEPRRREKYADLAGYERTIELMRNFGIGVADDAQFDEFVRELNERHGLDRMPALDTLLFHSLAREDANRFAAATVRELALPVVRMSLEESFQGIPMLVISAEGIDFRNRQNYAQRGFSRPMTLVMEDIDLWQAPDFDFGDDKEFSRAQQSALHSAREALSALRATIESPNVYVLATASNVSDIDPFFMELLEPATVIDIELPSAEERLSLWRKLASDHASLADIPKDDLVRLSAGMPRYDMIVAAREAIEEAYKYSLVTRAYAPVTAQNIFEKLAAFQPLDSDAYAELEQKVLEDFRADLDRLDDLLDDRG